ncbi:Xylem cysteine proteinase 1 [Platanthera zijinensis]|uniref:Xylem cysteine proteinase 1 n=1 Tax=Platanthera zijinensis TaxID=2320716 RepID=A0AAP0BLG9_9ASPA
MEDRHDRWMVEHGKVYENAAEKAARFEIFKSNMEHIESFNARKEKYWLGPNQFTDLTNQEFKILYSAGYRPSSASVSPATRFRQENVTVDASASLDWRSKGAVTPIKDQGQCGACWAFSAVAAIESINQIKSGKLVSLSEQELIDCDISGEDQGCEGGLMDTAFKFIVDNHGINSEANYPFAGEDSSCNSKKASVSAVKISGFEDVPANNEAALLKAVTGQPVSVAIDGGDPNFQSYAGGTFTGPCDTQLDHAVTAIGYGTDADGTKYWLVKNSWGTRWGNNGYIKMERDISSPEGLCGLAKQPSYPTIN